MRILRRLRRRLIGWGEGPGGGALHLLYHPMYRKGLTGVAMDALRGERILTWLLDEGWIPARHVVEPRPASVENLLRAHPASHLRAIEDPEEVGRIMGLPLTSEEARSAVAMQRLVAGGTTHAVRLALRSGGVAFHLGGGLHHASAERGGGFCLLNDVAVAIRRARARGFDETILVVDLDVHDGNGTRAIFAKDPTVHTFSMHGRNWDPPDAIADTSIELGPGADDGAWLDRLKGELPAVVEAHEPALTIYLAGVDAAAGDTYGDGRMTLAGLLERDRFVTRTVRGSGRGRPFVVLLAGGYGPSAWRPSARYAAWLATGGVHEPPDDFRVALRRAGRKWSAAGATEPPVAPEPKKGSGPFDWSFGAGDLEAVGGAQAPDPLLLGRFGARAVEEDLDRFGILDQLRNRGYPSPAVVLAGATGFGPVVRIWGERERRNLLVEIRLEEDRATLPDHPLLRIEWLLLQDPRATFTTERPPLPGQEHPGLGMLADVVAWLVMLCRRLDLDGLVFRTAHWHVATLARRHIRFLSDEDAARFDAVRHAVSGLSLAEAAAVVERNGGGSAIGWSDLTYVVPVGAALDRVVVGGDRPSSRPDARNSRE